KLGNGPVVLGLAVITAAAVQIGLGVGRVKLEGLREFGGGAVVFLLVDEVDAAVEELPGGGRLRVLHEVPSGLASSRLPGRRAHGNPGGRVGARWYNESRFGGTPCRCTTGRTGRGGKGFTTCG